MASVIDRNIAFEQPIVRPGMEWNEAPAIAVTFTNKPFDPTVQLKNSHQIPGFNEAAVEHPFLKPASRPVTFQSVLEPNSFRQLREDSLSDGVPKHPDVWKLYNELVVSQQIDDFAVANGRSLEANPPWGGRTARRNDAKRTGQPEISFPLIPDASALVNAGRELGNFTAPQGLGPVQNVILEGQNVHPANPALHGGTGVPPTPERHIKEAGFWDVAENVALFGIGTAALAVLPAAAPFVLGAVTAGLGPLAGGLAYGAVGAAEALEITGEAVVGAREAAVGVDAAEDIAAAGGRAQIDAAPAEADIGVEPAEQKIDDEEVTLVRGPKFRMFPDEEIGQRGFYEEAPSMNLEEIATERDFPRASGPFAEEPGAFQRGAAAFEQSIDEGIAGINASGRLMRAIEANAQGAARGIARGFGQLSPQTQFVAGSVAATTGKFISSKFADSPAENLSPAENDVIDGTDRSRSKITQALQNSMARHGIVVPQPIIRRYIDDHQITISNSTDWFNVSKSALAFFNAPMEGPKDMQ